MISLVGLLHLCTSFYSISTTAWNKRKFANSKLVKLPIHLNFDPIPADVSFLSSFQTTFYSENFKFTTDGFELGSSEWKAIRLYFPDTTVQIITTLTKAHIYRKTAFQYLSHDALLQLVVSIPILSAQSCHLLGKINYMRTFFSIWYLCLGIFKMADNYGNLFMI